MQSQAEKGHTFRALHNQQGAFLMPNRWDIGTARLLELLGFPALASTSAGYAFSQGSPDNGVARDQLVRHLTELTAATDVPVSADLENGYGDSPDIVAETIRRAVGSGVAGASIEDTTGRTTAPLHELGLATERIRSAVDVARSLNFPFTVTAR
jgi:2-methylisocitrate lyase-like PEP mutase family enzyme